MSQDSYVYILLDYEQFTTVSSMFEQDTIFDF